ncbi:oligouridylate-binding protein 1C-like [Durio zibethinus]|uniref:Oligouridylate-binding protein 1C-like n=1 Tax=Durio zibethinus TaxID=66656 RepID=A0A6P5XSE5_DURZI|nr:oligouridylate-binding protein 1C-like [Durio zibethinus]
MLKSYVVNQLKCSWGCKPTAPGTSCTRLPPPAAVHMPGLSAADLAAYERHTTLSKYGGAQVTSTMHPQRQHALKQVAMGTDAAGASQAIYDGGYQNVATTQYLMFYR